MFPVGDSDSEEYGCFGHYRRFEEEYCWSDSEDSSLSRTFLAEIDTKIILFKNLTSQKDYLGAYSTFEEIECMCSQTRQDPFTQKEYDKLHMLCYTALHLMSINEVDQITFENRKALKEIQSQLQNRKYGFFYRDFRVKQIFKECEEQAIEEAFFFSAMKYFDLTEIDRRGWLCTEIFMIPRAEKFLEEIESSI